MEWLRRLEEVWSDFIEDSGVFIGVFGVFLKGEDGPMGLT